MNGYDAATAQCNAAALMIARRMRALEQFQLGPMLMLLDGIRRRSAEAMREFVLQLASAIEAEAIFCPRATASDSSARVSKRRIYVPFITDVSAFVAAIHEMVHCLIGNCPGTGNHLRERRTELGGCVACETEVWRVMQQLVPFDAAMIADMKHYLGSYVDATPMRHGAHIDAQRVVGLDVYQHRSAWVVYLDTLRDHQRGRGSCFSGPSAVQTRVAGVMRATRDYEQLDRLARVAGTSASAAIREARRTR